MTEFSATAHFRTASQPTEWYHGSGAHFDHFDFGHDRSDHDSDYEPGHKEWNSRLGAHFSPEHRVATELGAIMHGHVYHVHLDLKNPKHYPSENDLDSEGRAWALANGHGDLADPSRGSADPPLTTHPRGQAAADAFRQHLQSQGHDGITYGNEYEGTSGHHSAIVFHPDQAKITHVHGPDDPCEHSTTCEHCGRLRYPNEGERFCSYCVHGFREQQAHSATAHFREAAVPNGWHQDPDHAHISRGMEIEPDDGWHPEAAHRILSGTATHEDLFHHINTDRIGHYWATHNPEHPGSLEDAKQYAEPREPIANWTRHAEPGENVLGAAGVILVGHRPHGWNPDDNPDEGLMGNSYLPDHSHIPLHEVHYSGDGENWHRLTPPAGTTVHTDGPGHSVTAFFRGAYDAPEGGGQHVRDDDSPARARDDRPRGRSGDPAQAGDGRRPQPGQPERAAAQGRRVQAAAEVERHPELQGDLDRLGGGARHVQDTITALQHSRSGVTTYPLSHPLEGWHAAITSGGHQVVHRVDPDTKTLHVGYAGHNVADAEERLGASSGSSALPVEFHKGAEKDFDNLHPEVQEKALNTIDRLARGEQHKFDHALTGKHWETGGWRSARADFLHRVTHRFEDNEGNPTSHERAARLFIGHIGPHNYEAAQKRLSSLIAFFRQADWDSHTREEGVHRGLAVVLPKHIHDFVHDPNQPEPARAHMLLSEIKKQHAKNAGPEGEEGSTGGLGNYWSPIPDKAPEYASEGGFKAYREHENEHRCGDEEYGEGGCPTTHVLLHADTPSEKHEWREQFRPGEKYDPAYSWRLPVRPGAPVNVRSVAWREGNDHWPMDRRHSDEGRQYNRETPYTRYDFSAPVKKRADVSATAYFRETASEEQLLQRQAAAVTHDDGVMVAFVPPPEIAAQLAQDGGQMADDLHITLAYLGNVGDYTGQQLTLLPQLVSAWAMRQKTVTIRIGGVGKFTNAFKDQHVLWAHPDIPGGVQMHVSLARELEQYGFHLPSEHGWTPHMTLRYVNEHFRFMPHLPEIGWEATEVVTFIGPARHAARLGLRPSTPTTL